MKTKTGRLMYLVLIYILSAPITVLWLIGWTIFSVVGNKRAYGKFDVVDTIKAITAGLKTGHEINMFWVNYGIAYQENVLNSLMDESE